MQATKPGSVAAFIMLSLASPLAFAQDAGLDEIIVTATKREQQSQDIPLSLQVVSGDSLAEQGIGNLFDLSKTVPNFDVAFNVTSNSITMRGFQFRPGAFIRAIRRNVHRRAVHAAQPAVSFAVYGHRAHRGRARSASCAFRPQLDGGGGQHFSPGSRVPATISSSMSPPTTSLNTAVPV